MVDACGNCSSVSDPNWNSCIGCNGLPNDSEYDCSGTCGGNYQSNPCGYCIDSTRTDFKTYGLDCRDVCGTEYQFDECNNCLLTTDSTWNSCVGCDGIANSGKEINPCGICMSTDLSTFSTAGQDCSGVCYGEYVEDLCGNCLLTTDESWDNCVGCDGIANSGKEINPCGYCVLGTAANFDTYGMCIFALFSVYFYFYFFIFISIFFIFVSYIGTDCNGTCPTSARDTHYIDDCGNCLLTTDDEWNSCINNNDNTNNPIYVTNTEVGQLKKKEDELTTVIVVVCIVAFLIIVAACIIIGALWKKQGQIDDRFNSLAATYQVMDENPQHSIQVKQSLSSAKKKKSTKKGLQTVPDEESGEDE